MKRERKIRSLLYIIYYILDRGDMLFIAVYAICKNEERFVSRWMSSMSEADGIYVLDTGSEDGTAEALRALGAEVATEIIEPWRFDTARNRSLERVPETADICVCTDLDEVFRPGWRQALEKAWLPGTDIAAYRYTWSFTPEGREGVVFYTEKAHARHGLRWTHPVHEVLTPVSPGRSIRRVEVPGMQLDHHPDERKSREQYLPLLELSVEEDPEDDRNRHYLGREYMFRGRWEDCIRTLRYHLAMPTAVWPPERCASMRYIARSYAALGETATARAWLHRAIAEAPGLREPYVDMALLLYRERDWEGVVWSAGRALAIRERPRSYICEDRSWGELPWDLRSLGLYYTGRIREALAASEEALRLAPHDGRIAGNRDLFRTLLAEAE